MFSVIKRIMHAAGSYQWKLKLSFVFSLLHSMFEMVPIIAIVYLFSHLSQIDGRVIMTVFGMMLFSIIGRMIFKYQLQDKQSGTGYEIYAEKRIQIGNKLKRVPLGYFDEQSLGDITAALTTTLGDLEMMSMMILDSIVSGIMYVVLMGCTIFFFDWHIGVITLIGLVVSILINQVMLRISARLGPKRQEAQANMVGAVLEYIQGMGVVKSFGLGKGNQDKVNQAFAQSRQRNLDIERGMIKLMTLYQWIFKLAACAVIVTAPYLLLGGSIDFSKCVMLLIASFMIYAPLETMGSFSSLIRLVDASLDLVEAVENMPVLDETSRDIALDRFDIELQNVSFAYGDREVIQDVSYSIPQNTTTAIIGPSGSGKTTLCSLIARFWDVQKGTVRVGGVDVRDITCDSLLKNMSMVFQNVYLFNDTIAGNIRFGKPDATRGEITEAAKKARCHDFIMSLPEGYETMVGESGSSLSGGEKQRISIARAILKDAPIIILDEATASIDPENEFYIRQAFDELTRDKTLIIIAHRLSTIKNADQILVLENGQIVQRGNHQELYGQEGIYRRFIDVRNQSAGWQLG